MKTTLNFIYLLATLVLLNSAQVVHANSLDSYEKIFGEENLKNSQKFKQSYDELNRSLSKKEIFRETDMNNPSKRRLAVRITELIRSTEGLSTKFNTKYHNKLNLPALNTYIRKHNSALIESLNAKHGMFNLLYSFDKSGKRKNTPIANSLNKTNHIKDYKKHSIESIDKDLGGKRKTNKNYNSSNLESSQKNPYRFMNNTRAYIKTNGAKDALAITKTSFAFGGAVLMVAIADTLSDYGTNPLRIEEFKKIVSDPWFIAVMTAFHYSNKYSDHIMNNGKRTRRFVQAPQLSLSEIQHIKSTMESPHYKELVQKDVRFRHSMVKLAHISGIISAIGILPDGVKKLHSCFKSSNFFYNKINSKDESINNELRSLKQQANNIKEKAKVLGQKPQLDAIGEKTAVVAIRKFRSMQDKEKHDKYLMECDQAWEEFNSHAGAMVFSSIFPTFGLYFAKAGAIRAGSAIAKTSLGRLTGTSVKNTGALIKNMSLVRKVNNSKSAIWALKATVRAGSSIAKLSGFALAIYLLEKVYYKTQPFLADAAYSGSLKRFEKKIKTQIDKYKKSKFDASHINDRESRMNEVFRKYQNKNIGFLNSILSKANQSVTNWNKHVNWVDHSHKAMRYIYPEIIKQIREQRKADPNRQFFTKDFDINNVSEHHAPFLRSDWLLGIAGQNYNSLNLKDEIDLKNFNKLKNNKLEKIDRAIVAIYKRLETYRRSSQRSKKLDLQYHSLLKVYKKLRKYKVSKKDYNILYSAFKDFNSNLARFSKYCNEFDATPENCLFLSALKIVNVPKLYSPGESYIYSLEKGLSETQFITNIALPKRFSYSKQKNLVDFTIYQMICGKEWTSKHQFIDRNKGSFSKYSAPRIVPEVVKNSFCHSISFEINKNHLLNEPIKFMLGNTLKEYKSVAHLLYEEADQKIINKDITSWLSKAEKQYNKYWEVSDAYYKDNVVDGVLRQALSDEDRVLKYPVGAKYALIRTHDFALENIKSLISPALVNDVEQINELNQLIKNLKESNTQITNYDSAQNDTEAHYTKDLESLIAFTEKHIEASVCSNNTCNNISDELKETKTKALQKLVSNLIKYMENTFKQSQSYYNMMAINRAKVL